MGDQLLTELDGIPPGLLDLDARHLHRVLDGPTLIHIDGTRPLPLFVSVLLHGNEHTGWNAVRALLGRYHGRPLPRAVSLFIGNVQAARENRRFLPGQADFNRIWHSPPGGDGPAHAMAREVVARMRNKGVFASIDIHNNTGINPHYACIQRMEHRYFHLATLFSRTVVYFRKPEGVQTQAFSSFCPAVTVECGQSGEARGEDHALDFLIACLRLSALPNHPVPPHDIDLFHTVAIVTVPEEVSIAIGTTGADLCLPEDLDHLNFSALPASTMIGRIRPGFSGSPLDVRDEQGRDAFGRFFTVHDHEIRTAVPMMLSMLSINLEAIRQDCLCYVMERQEVP